MSGGPVVPINPCTEAQRLRELLTAIAAGESVASARFGDEEIRYHKADTARLERLIEHYERECTVSQGGTPRRARHAMRMRHSLY